MVWSWVTLLEYRLDHHFLAEGHGWNCPDSPTRGLKQCGTSTRFVGLEREVERLQVSE